MLIIVTLTHFAKTKMPTFPATFVGNNRKEV
jgi:hypothetical protein